MLCAMGYSNLEIAAAAHVNVETVKSHLKAAFRVFGVSNRVQLALQVQRLDPSRWSGAERPRLIRR